MAPRRSPAGLVASFVLGACTAACAQDPSPPDLVLVTIDTLRADHLSVYGYGRPTSPFLEELADEAIVFEHAVAQCGTTPQSLSSLMTGLFPYSDGLVTQNDRFVFLRQGARSLAQVLTEHGYRTHGISATIQASSATGLDLGFESFDAPGTEKGARHRRAGEMTELALAWLAEQRDGDRPLFLWVHYIDPHYPYRAPESYHELWHPEQPFEPGETRPYRFDPKRSAAYPVSEGELAEMVIDYDREVRYVDDQLQHLVQEGLADRLERTVLVISADHGESLGQHRMIGHNDVFESILNVPLVLRLPDARGGGRRVSNGVMLVDLYPTVLELLGIPLDRDVRGRSLMPLFDAERSSPDRLLLAEYPDRRAAYLGHHKLIERTLPDGTHTWLFDLETDRGELQNLTGAGQLGARLARRAQRLTAHSLGPAAGFDEDLPEVTDEMLDELRALGY